VNNVASSLLLFLGQVSRVAIVPTAVDWTRLRAAGVTAPGAIAGLVWYFDT